MHDWFAIERIHQVTPETAAELDWMDKVCLPDDDVYDKTKPGTTWWVVRHHPSRRLAGFAGSLLWEPDNHVFLCRSGVLPGYRGRGLQTKLIRTRLRHARSIGADGAYTYVSHDNPWSGNNLIRCGFLLFEPTYAWAGEHMIYLGHDLQRQGC